MGIFKLSCKAECLRPLKSNGSVHNEIAICNLRAVHTRKRGRLGMGRWWQMYNIAVFI